jgi:hypothetical protein
LDSAKSYGRSFIPKYLEALGASIPVIGIFGTAEDFIDAGLPVSGRMDCRPSRSSQGISDLHSHSLPVVI